MSAWPPAMARVMIDARVMAATIISMMSIGSAVPSWQCGEASIPASAWVRRWGQYWFRLCAACSLSQTPDIASVPSVLMTAGAFLHEWCGRLPVGRGHMFLSFG